MMKVDNESAHITPPPPPPPRVPEKTQEASAILAILNSRYFGGKAVKQWFWLSLGPIKMDGLNAS